MDKPPIRPHLIRAIPAMILALLAIAGSVFAGSAEPS